MAQVELERVSKIYPGGVKAVDAMDLRVWDAEFVVLVGPSGCGKSTTLRLISGLEEASSGLIRIGGKVVNGVAPQDRDIAMVFQNYALYPHLTVEQNLGFGLKLRRMPWKEIEARVRKVARILDIESLLGRRPRELSGGQKQRVALGRAIVREPAAFLLDEPLSNLDAQLRVSTRAELKQLHRRLRTTTIYVTHDQEEAMTLGERVVVLNKGAVQQSGAPMQVYASPLNRFVAGFIGTPPMNFLHGRIRMDGGMLMFEEGRPVKNAGSARAGELQSTEKGLTIPIPARLKEALAAQRDREVVLGLRPEHIGFRPAAGAEYQAEVSMRLKVIEPLGSQMDVYMSSGLHDKVVARAEAHAGLREDSQATVYIDMRRAHFFEPGETGMNLSLTSEPAHARA